MKWKKTLVALGGLGNRYRTIKSFIESNEPDEKIIMLSIKTPFFPVHLDQVFEFGDNIELVNFPLPVSDKFSTYCMRVLCLVFGFLGFSHYGGREVVAKKWFYSSPHKFLHANESRPLKIQRQGEKKNIISETEAYNAVHIRRGDNKAAVLSNDMEVFRRFIQSSRERVFVASDDIETKEALSQEFPSQVITHDFNLDRKSISSFKDALLEIEILVGAGEFQGSRKSSFSQLVNDLRGESADYTKASP